jgi:Family of unknown function (DUF6941)
VLIAWAVSCDSYDLRDDGTANIYAAGFDTFRVESLPAELELTILVRLLLEEDEEGELEVDILGPNTAVLGMLSHAMNAEPGPNHQPGYIVSQIEVLELRFISESEGTYSVELFTERAHLDPTNELRRRSIFFNVRLGLPDES